jgi:hypothetical protein
VDISLLRFVRVCIFSVDIARIAVLGSIQANNNKIYS